MKYATTYMLVENSHEIS